MSDYLAALSRGVGGGLGFVRNLIRTLTIPNNAGSNDPAIIIGPDVPTELQTYYNVGAQRIVAAIIYRLDANDYSYDALITVSGSMYRASGYTIAGVVTPAYTYSSNAWLYLIDVLLTNADLIGTNTTLDLDNDSEIKFNNVSMGRGLLPGGYVSSTADNGPFGVATTVLVTGTLGFPDGRAFGVEFGGGLITSLATNTGRFNFGTTGGTLVRAQSFGPSFGGNPANAHGKVFFKNNSGALVSTTVGLFITPSAGTVTHKATSDSPRWIKVTDEGNQANYSNLPQVVA